MRILTYVGSVDDNHPPASRCAARIMLADGSWSPVIFHGPDKITVRAQAYTWWHEQLALQQARQDGAARRAEAMRARRVPA